MFAVRVVPGAAATTDMEYILLPILLVYFLKGSDKSASMSDFTALIVFGGLAFGVARAGGLSAGASLAVGVGTWLALAGTAKKSSKK